MDYYSFVVSWKGIVLGFALFLVANSAYGKMMRIANEVSGKGLTMNPWAIINTYLKTTKTSTGKIGTWFWIFILFYFLIFIYMLFVLVFV